MNVWVRQCELGLDDVEGVYLGRPPSELGFDVGEHPVQGAEGMVLADRAGLEMALRDIRSEPTTEGGVLRFVPTGLAFCRWVGPGCDICDYQARVVDGGGFEVVEPHSGTCALREEAGS